MSTNKTTYNEIQLWDKIKAGDSDAFAQLYYLHSKALYNYGNKMVRNSTLVEDALHDLFVDIWNYRKNLSPAISVRAYLYASLRRKIAKRCKELDKLEYDCRWNDLHLQSDSQEEKLIEKECLNEQALLIEKLKSNLNNLSPRQYEAIVLYFYDKLSYSEIAVALEVNEQSVRNLIGRGIECLRQYSRLTISVFLLLSTLVS